MNLALYGATGPGVGRFSGVLVNKTKKWYYPYNLPQAQQGSLCSYVWQAKDVPADYQAGQGPPTGPTDGAALIVGFRLSTKSFDKGRASAQADGVGTPTDFPAPGDVHSLNLGHSALAAYEEDQYPGTGPTYSELGVYVLTRHHNYFAVYAWDANLAQLKSVIRSVLAYKAGAF